MTDRRRLVTLAGLAVALLSAVPAMAQTTAVACSDTSVLPNPVYLAGSSAFEPTLAQLAVQIKAKRGISIIYDPISSCSGVTDVSDSTQVLSGTAHYYVADATQSSGVAIPSCTLAGGTKPLIGVSDVAYDSCMGSAAPATIGEWHGPVQSMLIIVPKANVTTTAMSADQAAAIWGCGANGGVTPFTDENAIQQRSATSGTQIMVARAIGVPESAFKGNPNSSGSALITSLLAVANPQTAIGILAADAYATNRAKLNAVAFRGKAQTKAFYADSGPNDVDKKNVREGRYVIQGPLHFFTQLTAGQPAVNAQQVLDWLTGNKPIDPADTSNTNYTTTVALLGDVPQCAMKVQIDKDGGLFSPFTPPVSCNCFFETAVSLLAAPPAGCVACTSDAGCTGENVARPDTANSQLEDTKMNLMKIATVVLGLAYFGAIGCGSDGTGGGGTGGTIGGGTGGAGGSVGTDAAGSGGALATGGSTGLDAAGGTVSLDGGGAGGAVALDANIADAAFPVDGGPSSDSSGSEVGGLAGICAGLSAVACDVLIRAPDPATLPATVIAQNVPGPTPPAYAVCIAQ